MLRTPLVLLLAATTACASPVDAQAAEDSGAHCRLFRAIEQETSAGLGRLIDPVTRLSAIDLACADQVIHFRQELTIPEAALRPGWLARHRAHWSATYCRPGSAFEAAIRQGWTVATTITTSDGARFRLTAQCQSTAAIGTPSAT